MDTAHLSAVFPLKRMLLLLMMMTTMMTMMATGGASGEVCNGPRDIVFLVDPVGRTPGYFRTLQRFMRDLVNDFNISGENVRVAVVTYSKTPTVRFHLNAYIGKKALKEAIMNIPYQGGLPVQTAPAIRFCRTTMFKVGNGDRCAVSNVIVVLTKGSSVFKRDSAREAQACHREGIEVIVLGIGPGMTERKLYGVASDPDSEHAFVVSRVESIQTVQSTIFKKACGLRLPLNSDRPVHNCTDLGYISETGDPPTCMCTVEDLGYPAGRLVWMMNQTVLEDGSVGSKQLLLPSSALQRQSDRQQAWCQLTTKNLQSQVLSLNVAYGPDNVEIQIDHHYDTSYDPSIVITCHVTGVNPLTPDMVQWEGLCKGQRGFTCTLDPSQTDVKGKNVSCLVTNSANDNHSAEAEQMVEIVKPSKPGHNCTDMSYLPETGEVTCVCSADDLGFPPGRLVWRMGNTTLATAANNVHQLSLPPQYLKRGYDRQQLLCGLDWVKPEQVLLPLNIAYGPDNVTLQVYQHRFANNTPLTVIYCDVTGMTPLTPDMIQWGGLCQGQQGFRCTLNPEVAVFGGMHVTCEVTNTANNGFTMAHTITLEERETDPMQVVKPAVVGGSVAVLALILALTTLLCLYRRRLTDLESKHQLIEREAETK